MFADVREFDFGFPDVRQSHRFNRYTTGKTAVESLYFYAVDTHFTADVFLYEIFRVIHVDKLPLI